MLYIQDSKMLVLTEPAAIVDNAAETIAAIDTRGYDYLDVYLLLGATDIALTVCKLRQADDNATYTDIVGADYSVSPATLPTALSDNSIFAWHVDLAGNQRYVKPSVTVGAGSTGGYMTIIAVLSRAKQSPDTAAKRGLAQELFV